jgi:hypothetical protein
MRIELELVRIEVNNAFDRWLYWQLEIRDLINAGDAYSCQSFDVSARRIKLELRHAHIHALSRVYRFECLRERMEDPSLNTSEPPEANR